MNTDDKTNSNHLGNNKSLHMIVYDRLSGRTPLTGDNLNVTAGGANQIFTIYRIV
jgi:hypothetical protein